MSTAKQSYIFGQNLEALAIPILENCLETTFLETLLKEQRTTEGIKQICSKCSDIISPLHFPNQPSRKMKASILAMFGLLALADAAPQYGYANNFSGSKKPLTGSYSNCKVEWRTVKKARYEEVTYEEVRYVNVCKTVYQTECKNVKVRKHLSLLETCFLLSLQVF